jgi:hypothetical protein
METKLEQIAVKAVNQLPKSVVREIRTPRSVGIGGGRPPPMTRCSGCNSLGLLGPEPELSHNTAHYTEMPYQRSAEQANLKLRPPRPQSAVRPFVAR